MAAPLWLIRDIRRQICTGKKIVFYCSTITPPPEVQHVNQTARETSVFSRSATQSARMPERSSPLRSTTETRHNASNITWVSGPFPEPLIVPMEEEEIIFPSDSATHRQSSPAQTEESEMETILNHSLLLTPDEISDQARVNPFGWNFNQSPFFPNSYDTYKILKEVLTQLPVEKAARFLSTSLTHPEATPRFYILCIRLICENFHEGGPGTLEKKKAFYEAVFSCLILTDKLEGFWNEAENSRDGNYEDGTPKPILKSCLEFCDACMIIGAQRKKIKKCLMTCLDKGYLFFMSKVPKLDRKNLLLENELNQEEQDYLVSIARETHLIYQDVAFPPEKEQDPLSVSFSHFEWVMTQHTNSSSKEWVQLIGSTNYYELNLDEDPCYSSQSLTHAKLLCILTKMPTEKAAYFLHGLLEHRHVSHRFRVFCLRLIHENFHGEGPKMPEKKKKLYGALLFAIGSPDKLETFWANALSYEKVKPTKDSLHEFCDACMILGAQNSKKLLLKDCLQGSGRTFFKDRIPKPDQRNPVLDSELNQEQKEYLISVAQEAGEFYKDVAF